MPYEKKDGSKMELRLNIHFTRLKLVSFTTFLSIDHGSQFHRVLIINVYPVAFGLTASFPIENPSRSFPILMYGIEAYWRALTPQPQQFSFQMVGIKPFFG